MFKLAFILDITKVLTFKKKPNLNFVYVHETECPLMGGLFSALNTSFT